VSFATRFGLIFCLAVSAYAQINGRWELDATIAAGEDHCILQLSETNGQVKGTYSGILGEDKPVEGTYKDQKLSLSFSGDWPIDGSPAQVKLDGSISGDSGSGNLVIVDRADGTWTAHRAKQAHVLPAANGAASVETAGIVAAHDQARKVAVQPSCTARRPNGVSAPLGTANRFGQVVISKTVRCGVCALST
jgi:hypothetical protein